MPTLCSKFIYMEKKFPSPFPTSIKKKHLYELRWFKRWQMFHGYMHMQSLQLSQITSATSLGVSSACNARSSSNWWTFFYSADIIRSKFPWSPFACFSPGKFFQNIHLLSASSFFHRKALVPWRTPIPHSWPQICFCVSLFSRVALLQGDLVVSSEVIQFI